MEVEGGKGQNVGGDESMTSGLGATLDQKFG